jgi:hypothetical protein
MVFLESNKLKLILMYAVILWLHLCLIKVESDICNLDSICALVLNLHHNLQRKLYVVKSKNAQGASEQDFSGAYLARVL